MPTGSLKWVGPALLGTTFSAFGELDTPSDGIWRFQYSERADGGWLALTLVAVVEPTYE